MSAAPDGLIHLCLLSAGFVGFAAGVCVGIARRRALREENTRLRRDNRRYVLANQQLRHARNTSDVRCLALTRQIAINVGEPPPALQTSGLHARGGDSDLLDPVQHLRHT